METPVQPRPSTYALALARDIAYWPEDAAKQLGLMLANLEAIPTSQAIRDARLGLLIDIVLDPACEEVTMDDYDARRCVEKLRGREWPDSETLRRAYNDSWGSACAMARSVSEGSAYGVSIDGDHWRRRSASFSPADVHDALIRCRDALRRWPRPTEFEEWGRFERARQKKNPSRQAYRIPRASKVRKVCGSWERGIDQAKQVLDRRQTRCETPLDHQPQRGDEA